MLTTSPSPNHVPNPSAWTRFCELIAHGGGVSDHPSRLYKPIKHASSAFFQLEVSRVEHHRSNLLPFLIDHCKLSGLKVLEFGAGTGGLSVAMALAGVKPIDAIEPVALNCEAGRWRTKAYGLEDSIRFHHVPDTRQLPFADRTFDAVVCSSVLQYVAGIEERQMLLKEMARVTRAGGQLIFCSTGNGIYPAGPHSTRWWSNLFPALASRLGHDRGITFWEINNTLKPLGFRITPQGNAALERWHGRVAVRCKSFKDRFIFNTALNLFRITGITLGAITRAPLEAFLPYPDLAFRLEAAPSTGSALIHTRQAHV